MKENGFDTPAKRAALISEVQVDYQEGKTSDKTGGKWVRIDSSSKSMDSLDVSDYSYV